MFKIKIRNRDPKPQSKELTIGKVNWAINKWERNRSLWP